MTTDEVIQEHPDSILQTRKSTSYWPYEQYLFPLSQDGGVFSFDYSQYDIAEGSAHEIHDNTFRFIFCYFGCAYSAKGTNVQQFWFESNTYHWLVATGGGSVFDSSHINLPDSNKFRDVWLQAYIGEYINNNIGGAIRVKSTNVPITLIEETAFVGNMGDEGASISFD